MIYRTSLFLSLCFIITCTTGVFSTLYAWNNQTDGVKIKDIMHSVLPDWSNLFSFPNLIFPLQWLLAMFSIEDRFKTVAQFIFLNCIVLTLRSISITLTVLPNPVDKEFCLKRPDNIFELIDYMRYGTCGDFCFSGHTSTSMLTYLTVLRFGKRQILKQVQLAFVVFMVFLLLAMRWHYSVDCFIALLISYFIFDKYYAEEDDSIFYFNSCSSKRRKRLLSVAKQLTIYDDDL
jgi:hypothetical protein